MNHAFDYCKTPDNVSKQELISALHEAYLQLIATQKVCSMHSYDNKYAVKSACKCLEKAGHIGFTK